MNDNEMNDLEKQLRLWTPRRPSARLEWRLFAWRPTLAEASEAPVSRHASPRFAFLVPATALLLVACGWLTQHYGSAEAHSGRSGPLVAMILSNQSAPAYLPGSFDRHQNHLGNTFEWTNGRGSPPSVPSLSAPRTSD